MKLILRLTILLSMCDLSGCAGVARPDADICAINFASDKPAHLHCYNVKNDYGDDGILKAGAKAQDIPITSPQMLNAGKYVSKEDWPKYQVWFQDGRNYVKGHCK